VDGDLKCVQAGIGCGSEVGVYSLELKADDKIKEKNVKLTRDLKPSLLVCFFILFCLSVFQASPFLCTKSSPPLPFTFLTKKTTTYDMKNSFDVSGEVQTCEGVKHLMSQDRYKHVKELNI
jgi:hypothetical protein